MSTCWKCGHELPQGQTECDYGCISIPVDQVVLKAEEAYWAAIDWSKVKTVEDVVKILSTLHPEEGVFTEEPEYEQIKHLCHPPEKVLLSNDDDDL